jgi:SAM-dependent methyltransferase
MRTSESLPGRLMRESSPRVAKNVRALNMTQYHTHSESEIEELKDYILHRELGLDRDLLPYGDPEGKDVLVFGCGFGNEVLWAARHGAKSILAIDLSPALSPVPFERALAEAEINYTNYEFRRENIHDTALKVDRFDLVVSNGVFEHVLDLKGVLSAFRACLRPQGRIAIFADGLWFSSLGGHIGKGPWEHLWRSAEDLKPELSERQWDIYCNQLNRMTVIDFIEGIRAVGAVVLRLVTGRDPNLRELNSYMPRIAQQMAVSPTDLSIVSIGCELCFPENLPGATQNASLS